MLSEIKDLLGESFRKHVFLYDTWIRLVAILLFVDIFLGMNFQDKTFDLNAFNDLAIYFKIIVGAIFYITFLKYSPYLILIIYVSTHLIDLFDETRKDENQVSCHDLHEYSMITNNVVVARIADKLKKEEESNRSNIMFAIGTILMFYMDLWLGVYLSELFHGVLLIITVPVMIIVIGFLLNLLGKINSNEYIYSTEFRDEISKTLRGDKYGR